MSRFAHIAGRALVVVASLAAAGCPPPPDPEGHGAQRRGQAAVKPAAATPPVEPGAPTPRPGPAPDPNVPPTSSVPQAPVPTATPKQTTYEHLAGGIYVARCTSCGAVQPEASTQCPSCGQLLTPWRHEQLCTVCVGSGKCERCGDDRACLDCDGLGACPYCDGTGKRGGQKCTECDGNGKCAACGGDGVRESAGKDFGPYETRLPGICPTCLDGSGLCPECGTLTKNRAGGTCLTCGGLGICFDCGGTGLCPHDAGDGLCVVCRGGGREILDGEPYKLSDRTWKLRNSAGVPVSVRTQARPDPNVHAQVFEGATPIVRAFTRSQVDPLSYYFAMRDWTRDDDAKGRMELGTIALSSGFWAVAQQDFRRAMAADPQLSLEAAAQLREIDARRAQDWLDRADAAKKHGDRDGASLLLALVRFKLPGTPLATRADIVRIAIQREREEEEKNLDDASKQRIAAEAQARPERAAAAARLRLDRARKLLDDVQKRPSTDPEIEMLFARADEAAYSAQRVVQKEAARDPEEIVAWPVKPKDLLDEARRLRAQTAVRRAAREIAAGRFDFGRRLALRTSELDATNAESVKLIEQADLGLARLGVLRASGPRIPK